LRKVNKGWRLDYFLLRRENLNIVQDSTIHNEFMGSDHCPILLTLNLNKLAYIPHEEEKIEEPKIKATKSKRRSKTPAKTSSDQNGTLDHDSDSEKNKTKSKKNRSKSIKGNN
jgi:hypothetical protein